MLNDNEYLLVIRVMSNLNLTILDACCFEGVWSLFCVLKVVGVIEVVVSIKLERNNR